MTGFKIAVFAFALIPLLTGLGDVVLGAAVWQNLGVDISGTGLRDPVLDSQVRFMATIWFAYGGLLCWCLKDLERYASILRGALLAALLGGVARVVSIVDVGMPEAQLGSGFIIFALVIEFVFVPILLFWQYKLRGESV